MLIQTDRKNVAMGGMVAQREFGMKAGSHLMSILSGLYENPMDAMVREYLTNMYDACLPILKAGGTVLNPILRLPTKMTPKLEFQDFGIGMDFETVWKVYAEYGNSTKSDTNDAVGGFGLGSKTAFCYNNGAPWNIVATKDGVTNRFMAFIGENGAPTMTHIGASQTSEPNGVTVSIPIRIADVEEVLSAAKKYLPHFPIPLVVENLDEVPEPITYRVKGTDWGIVDKEHDRYGNRNVIVVMGNVPYSVDIRGMFNLGWNTNRPEMELGTSNDIVLTVPIGSVDVTPSRDSLKVTDRTKATIQSALNAALDELPSLVDGMIAGAKTSWEKIQLRYDLLNKLSLPDSVRAVIDQNGIGSVLKVAVPTGAEVTRFSITDAYKATPVMTDNQTELEFRAGVHKNKGVSVVIVNDTKKPIAGMCRAYIRKHYTSIGHSGRANNYGHALCNLFSVKLPSTMGVDTFTQTLDGFTNVLLASDLVGTYTTTTPKGSLKGKIYKEQNGKFMSRSEVPTGATEYYYVTVTKPTPKGRYGYDKEMYNLRTIAAQLDVMTDNTDVYGVKEADVAELPSEWINLEEAVADAMIQKLRTNSAIVKPTIVLQNEKHIDFLRAVKDVIPEALSILAEFDRVTKKSDDHWKLVGRFLRDVELAVRQSQMDRINLVITELATLTALAPAMDIDAEAKRVIESNQIVQMMYDVYATPVYHVGASVPKILKKYLVGT